MDAYKERLLEAYAALQEALDCGPSEYMNVERCLTLLDLELDYVEQKQMEVEEHASQRPGLSQEISREVESKN